MTDFSSKSRYLYLSRTLSEVGALTSEGFSPSIDRASLKIDVPPLTPVAQLAETSGHAFQAPIWRKLLWSVLSPVSENARRRSSAPFLDRAAFLADLALSGDYDGVIIEMDAGWLSVGAYLLSRRLVRSRCDVILYWNKEEAAERLTDHTLRAHTILKIIAYIAGKLGLVDWKSALHSLETKVEPFLMPGEPVPFRSINGSESEGFRVCGAGLYLRQDFWNPRLVGGSYAHTVYVAKELDASSADLFCLVANEFRDFDRFGLRSKRLNWPLPDVYPETSVFVDGGVYFYNAVRLQAETLKPAYIYERLCFGNAVGARVSRELGIPYIIEYNGSELTMLKSFSGKVPDNSEFLVALEAAAFSQATIISVVSEGIAHSLIERGVSAAKILVNPNGVDTDEVRPPSDKERLSVRRELGLSEHDCVVCFSGTFGGWHGVSVLAEAIPRIIAKGDAIKFLLIGDGNLKSLVDDQVIRHGLQDMVVSTGLVAPENARRYLHAADICLVPHDRDFADMPFFGSPIKVFEYLASGAAIVASDLRQIGEVLRPAVDARRNDWPADVKDVKDARAVLVQPGDVDGLVSAVLKLSEDELLRAALGANGRKAAVKEYSWKSHVQRLWAFAHKSMNENAIQPVYVRDIDKAEVQRQWDSFACGSEAGEGRVRRSIEFYEAIEASRYEQYAPWMLKDMGFEDFPGKRVLEIGAGMGTDLVQFAKAGADVYDLDLSVGHLAHARDNFDCRRLRGHFAQGDAENLPFPDNSFDVVYSNGVIHHTPDTRKVIEEVYRVLKPGGKSLIMVYSRNSWHFWRNIVWHMGIRNGMLMFHSTGYLLSRYAEVGERLAKPLVKVYTPAELRELFARFPKVEILRRQFCDWERPRGLRWIPTDWFGKTVGWNLVVKAEKPVSK